MQRDYISNHGMAEERQPTRADHAFRQRLAAGFKLRAVDENQAEPGLIAQLLRQALAEGVQAHLTLTSDSMAPLLRREDRLVLQAVEPCQLQAGDIVVVADSEGLLVHRFWGFRICLHPAELVLRGDSLAHFDQPVPVEALVGLVIARLRNGKILYLDRPPGSELDGRLRRALLRENRFYPFPWESSKALSAESPSPLSPVADLSVVNRIIRWLLRRYMRAVVALTSPRAESTLHDG